MLGGVPGPSAPAPAGPAPAATVPGGLPTDIDHHRPGTHQLLGMRERRIGAGTRLQMPIRQGSCASDAGIDGNDGCTVGTRLVDEGHRVHAGHQLELLDDQLQALAGEGVVDLGHVLLEGLPGTWVSYGYDKVRFPAPLFIGDTVTVDYEIVERDPAQRKTFARVTCTTQRGDVVCAATHILKGVE